MEQDSNESARRVLWPVKTEAATVIAEMRQNAKWASNRPAMLYMQDPSWALLYNLQQLRMSHHSTMPENSEPLQFLQPFLDIITSAEASGPITGAALVSVRKLLHSPVLSHFPSASVARAMHAVVVALGACKFEATNPWHDQAVLTRILQTLEACIACPSGRLLSNTDACAVFQAVYRIGFDTQVVQELSELLVNLVKESLLTMVRIMFSHAARTCSIAQATSANASGTSLNTAGLLRVADSNHSLHAQDSLAESSDRLTARSAHDRPASVSRSSSHRMAVATAESLDESVPLSIPGVKHEKGSEGYGQPAVGHILQFLTKLARVEPMRVFALDLIQEGVAAGGSALLQMPSILRRLQVELVDSMLATFRGDARVEPSSPRALPDALMRMTHLVLTLYVSLKRQYLLQAELFIQAILLPLAKGTLMPDSRGSTPQVLSEAAQECLADLAVFPGFLQEVYASLDCRVECSNLFEDMCQVIAQRTHPSAHTGRSAASALALKSATAVLHSVIDAEALPESISVPPACLFTSKARSDLWHAVSRGEEPTCEGLMAQLNQGTEAEEVGGNAWRELCGVRRVQWEKFLKTKLEDAIKLFNEDYRKGFQMMQVSHILPDPMDSRSVASLLRFARGIDRQIVGNFMGKGESFNQEVMAEYVRTFPFDRLSFDAGFRAFADTFKQPPESQQVVRFTKNFVQAFLEAHNGDYRGFRTMKSLDDFMTVCLWHNSTWYNSNPKVPKMRDVPQFRATMEESLSDHDTPDEAIFAEMYHSICTTAFPQGTNEQFKADMPLARLSLTAQRSDTPRGQVQSPSRFHTALHRDMFSLCWGPLVRAVAALLEAAAPEEPHIITDGMGAMRAAAAAAKACHAEGVVDAILNTLAQFTMPADPGVSYPRAVVEFGSSLLAREATLTLFSIASEYADQLRSGWATCLACVLRLHQLRLVDASVFSDAQGDEGMPLAQRSNGQRREPEAMNLLGFFFAPPPPTELTPEERRFQEGAKETVAQCRIGALFDDSKFLATPALHELVRAVAVAASPRSSSQDGSLRDDTETAEFERFYSGGLHDSYGGRGAGDAVDLEVAEACLELLMKIAIRNRDRIQVVLPVLKEQVARCVRGATPGAVVLTQRAVVGLLRVCTRLLMYRSDVTEELVDCLKVVQNLNLSPSGERHVHQLAPAIARSLLALMSACCDQIESPAAWEVLLSLLESTTSHPDSVLPVHAALDTICRDGRGMSAANYMHVVTAVRALVVSACSAWMAAEQTREAGREAVLPFDDSQIRGSVDLLEMAASWLQTWRQRQAQASALPDSSENEMQRRRWLAELATYWHHLLRAVAYTCVEPLAPVRDHALVVMHRCMDVAGEHLKLPHETWGSTWRDIILPMLADLAGRMQEVSGMSAAGNMRRAGMDTEEKAVAHSMCIMINIVHKTFVARVAELSRLRDWRGLWLSTLQGLKMCTSTTEAAASADVRVAVVQAMGGMIHTLHARKLLWANSRDREGLNMWDRTFAAAMEVSPELSPESLGVLA